MQAKGHAGSRQQCKYPKRLKCCNSELIRQPGTSNQDFQLLPVGESPSVVQPGSWIHVTPVAPLGVTGNGQRMTNPSGICFLLQPGA